MDTFTNTTVPTAAGRPYFSGGGEVNPKTGLPSDAANLFAPLMYAAEGLNDSVMGDVLLRLMNKPLKTFEEYINSHAYGDSQYAARIFSQSDPAKVAALDALITMFNADRERVVRERDFAAAQATWNRAAKLIYGSALPLVR